MTKLTLIELFKLGGVFMWPLLVFSIATIAIIIERVLFFLFHNLKVSDVEKNVLNSLENKNIKEATEYCKNAKKSKVGAKIILEGLKMAKLGEHRMEKAIESEANEKINSLENGFNLLTALASLSPLTGFLGTVSGMISAFQAIANAQDVNAQLVAGGIFEALITTVFGLIIAIIAITGYSLLSHVVDKFAKGIERLGTDVITAVIVNDLKE